MSKARATAIALLGLAGLVVGIVAATSGPTWLAVASGVAAAVAAVIALALFRRVEAAASLAEQRGAQLAELDDAIADQVKARLAAEESVDSLNRQLEVERARPPDSVAKSDRNDAAGLTDAITGLFSEEYFNVSLDARIATARRHLRPVAIVLMELVEELEAGEPVEADAHAVTSSINATLRDSDTACRLDDGLFSLILEDTPENGAIWTIERLRRHLAEHKPGITMWAGVACYPAHAFERERLLEQAETALIAAKDWRQDRIEVASGD